ncbi:MAG: diiron oxygenase [Chromatiales bacterium]|nr:diiron oxygenase [Chromatiales bacterium]
MNQAASELLEQLNRNSTPYQDPLVRVDWEALSFDRFWLPEPALSLHGLPEFDRLDLDIRLALSRYEFIHFIEGALWLESLFMERIARAAARPEADLTRASYRLHELREEAGHSLMFLELMRRSRLPLPRTRFRRANLANLIGRHAPFESPLFWIAVLIGEEVPDRMNRLIRKHRDDICPTIHDIITLHVMDEARHMAHARETVTGSLDGIPPWLRRVYRPIYRPMMNRVFGQFVEAFYYPPARVYELAGLTPGKRWARRAWDNPQRTAFVRECVSPVLRLLADNGLTLGWR